MCFLMIVVIMVIFIDYNFHSHQYGHLRDELTIYNEISNEQKTFDELLEMENETFLCRYENALFRFNEDSCEEIKDIIFYGVEEIIIVDKYGIIKYSLKSKKIIKCLDYHESGYSQYIDHKK